MVSGGAAGRWRVVADRAACCGYALCEETCPQMFRLGDDSVIEVLQETVPEELVEQARRAVADCPAAALTLVAADD
jgi:ferredoxin